MKTLVFDPYLSTLGGGEHYALRLAEVAAEFSSVDVAGPRLPQLTWLVGRGFPSPQALHAIPSRRYRVASTRYDLAIRIANHLPSGSRARRSLLVVQFPQSNGLWPHPTRSARRRRLLADYEVIVYSQFVADWCARRWDVPAFVLPPGVEMIGPGVRPKTETILAVGRFFSGGNEKRQEVLVEAYRRLPEAVRRRWRLVIVGGAADPSAHREVERLRRAAAGHDVTVEVDASREQLVSLYRTATLFWHAAGFGRSSDRPEAAEHFGMATVEAMSAGAVPLVYDDGGQREIVAHGQNGIRWSALDDLVTSTVALVGQQERREEMAAASMRLAGSYSATRFRERALDVMCP